MTLIIICATLAIIGTPVSLKLIDRMPEKPAALPPHEHLWEEEDRFYCRVFNEESDKIPARHETTFLFRCYTCGEVKTQKLQGKFEKDK